MNEVITIIGAGIGGLTMGLILKQNGIPFQLFESATAIQPIGAGIIIANNAMQVYKKLAIHHKIETVGNKVNALSITDNNFNILSTFDVATFEKKYHVYNVAIHRADLQQILADEIGRKHIHLSKKIEKIEKINAGFQLYFEDGSAQTSKYVIAADGIKSTVRDSLFEKGKLRNAHQPCWRGVCEIELPEHYTHEALEAWHKGKRFGFVKINKNEVYWYALINEDNSDKKEIPLTERFKEFHPQILEIIKTTLPEKIFFSEIIDLKPIKKWHQKNICLIGDAAHATTPNLGQGACQAIEDTYIIGKLISNGYSLNDAFKAYNTIRLKKAHKVVNTSWLLGKIAHWENPIICNIRNFCLKGTPNSINRQQLSELFKLDE